MAASEVIVYKGGFLLARSGAEMLTALPDGERAVGHWATRRVGSYQLHFDPMFPCNEAAFGDAGIVCLGHICDVVRADGPEQTVGYLARAYALSQDALVDRLSDCGGTFVVFAYRRTEVEVFLDATGTVGVCYTSTNDAVTVGSHPNLLAELFGFRPSALAEYWLRHPSVDLGGRYFPGLKTAFDEVRVLTPNTMLRLPSGDVARIYPRQEIRERPLEEIVASVVPALRRQVEWLSSRARLAVSLSGGLDTRVTLSAMRPVAHDCLFFTYNVWDNPVHTMDLAIAAELSDALGLRHTPIVVSRDEQPPEWFLEDWRRTHVTNEEERDLVHAYCVHLGGSYIHVRSNVLEVTRGFYTKNPLNRKHEFDAYKLARLFRNATANEFTQYFEEFIEVTSFRPTSMQNYHYTDLFYWEHRLGSWLAGLLRATRADHHTFILYNCRRVIETMIARPLEERISADVMFGLMREMWPDVLSVPIFSGSKFLSAPGLPTYGDAQLANSPAGTGTGTPTGAAPTT